MDVKTFAQILFFYLILYAQNEKNNTGKIEIGLYAFLVQTFMKFHQETLMLDITNGINLKQKFCVYRKDCI